MKSRLYQVVFQPELEGGFTVYVPELPGCVSYGANLSEAKAMIQEAILLYLEDMRKEGEFPPEVSEPSLMSTVEVDLAELHA